MSMGRQGTPRGDASREDMPRRVSAYTSAHRQKRRWASVLSVLAALVVFVTVYALTVPAATMTRDLAALPEGAQVPEGYTHIQTARDEANGFAVTVYAPEGAVPEGATLKADLIAEDTDAYAEAEQAVAASQPAEQSAEGEEAQLAEGEKDYGFAALDIRFEDADGNEVEPAGDVYVSIDAAGLLPEDADPESVTVQHLAEDETGAVTSVDTVAAVAEDANTVQAAFAVDGFSTFTISWSSDPESEQDNETYYDTLLVQRINEQGTGIGDDFVVEGSEEEQLIVDDIAEAHPVEGYVFERAVIAHSPQEALNETRDVTAITNTNRMWQVRQRSFYGSDYDWTGLDGSTVYFIYEAIGSLTIDDSTLLSGGTLRPAYDDANMPEGTVSYQWERQAEGEQSWETVERRAVTAVGSENLYNVAENGSWLNVSLDDGARYTYRVKMLVNGEVIKTSSEYKVPYYDSLQNGDFESPEQTGDKAGEENFVGSGTEDVVWKTTGWSDSLGSRIELVGTNTYEWHGVNYCPPAEGDSVEYGSEQCAELNADSSGALYQDVLTKPGSTMYWSLMHNGRTKNGSSEYVGFGRRYSEQNPAVDSMYVVIMSTDMAEENQIDNQYKVQDVINSPDEYPGAQVVEIEYRWYWTRSGNNYVLRVYNNVTGQWETHRSSDQNKPSGVADNQVATVWNAHSGEYVVPSDQYLTRYFFVAGRTELGADESNTVGNHIDNVSFGTEVPDPADGTATLQIEKNITGLTVESYRALLDNLSFSVSYGNVSTTVVADDSGFSWDYTVDGQGNVSAMGTYTITNIPVPANGSVSYSVSENTDTAVVSGYDVVTTTGEGVASPAVAGGLSNQSFETASFTNAYTSTTTTLTLTKTFDGLSDAEVSHLIFGREDGFGWDINYCQDTTHEVNETDKNSYMATDVPDGLELPDGTPVEDGGGFRITAAQFLTGQTGVPASGSYTDEKTGATLSRNDAGDWVFSVTLSVPTTDEHHFYTVFEQHQEVPGYAKINDSNAEWTITTVSGSETGSGKFIDTADQNIYEDMKEVAPDGGDWEKTLNEREEACIENGSLRRISIAGPTTISFTNHYVGSLDVTKAIDEASNEYEGASDRSYEITVKPAHVDKLTLAGSSHGLAGKTVSYTITSGGVTSQPQTATLGSDGSLTLNLKPGEVARINDMPAIQWQVVEDTAFQANTVDGYMLSATYSDENNNVVSSASHWNGYAGEDTIGATAMTDGIASVDSAVRDDAMQGVAADSVACVTVTNSYMASELDLTFQKVASGSDTPLAGAEFVLVKLGDDGTTEQYLTDNPESPWGTELASARRFVSDEADGLFEIIDLEVGPTYYLREVTAPGGYKLLENDVTITWVNTNDPQVYLGDTPITSKMVSTTTEDSVSVYQIPNTTGATLPNTGGPGTNLITFGGLALVAAAVCGYGLRRSRMGGGARS